MKFVVVLFFLGSFARAFAQDKAVEGIIFDKLTKERIAEVHILNKSTGRWVYNNIKGEFNIAAITGDELIFTREGYLNDTVKVINYMATAVYLKPSSIQLKEVTVHDSALNPEQQLEATKRDYNRIYGPLGDKDYLSVSPGGGAGLSIDALYNTFSRSGRNAAKLREEIQRDYYQNVIDYRYNRGLVGRITGLKDAQLTDFMHRYRPGYYFVVEASEYEFIASIKANYKRYLRRPRAIYLQPLVPAK